MGDILTVTVIILTVVGLFVWDRFPVIVVCVGCALALWATGLLTLQQSLAGFGDPATIFVASLFAASTALEKTGVTAWVGQALIRGAGDSRGRLLLLMMLFSGLLSALISVNGGVAALLPVVVVLAVRLKRSPSKLLMPLVFGGHAGSMLALTGTPVNVLVYEAMLETGRDGFGYFEYALAGIPLLAGTVAIAVFFGERLLPQRESRLLPPDLSQHARTLVQQFGLRDGVHQLRVRPTSRLCGTPRGSLDVSAYEGLSLVTVKTASGAGMRLGAIADGDVILVRGPADAVAAMAMDLDLAPRDSGEGAPLEDALFNRHAGLAEVVIPPRSPLVGRRVYPGMVAPGGDLVLLAVQRRNVDLPAGGALAVGDTLLLQGTWDALDRDVPPAEVLVVHAPELVRRQALPMGPGAWPTLAVLAVMVVLLATGLVPAAVAGLLTAGALLLLKVLSVEDVYRGINWTTVILIGGMMPLSTAITDTGAARMLADGLIGVVGPLGPRALLAGLFLLTALLGQVISNVATALIIIPVAAVAATEMGLSPAPVLMSVAVAAAAALLTPVATPTNLMIMEPAGYRFGDYWKFGLPILAWYFVVAVGLVPLIWPF